MISAKAIIPSNFDKLISADEMTKVIENTLTGVTKDVEVDFKVTTQTWRHKPEFDTQKSPFRRIIQTGDEIYGYVSGGTRPHVIRPKRGKRLAFKTGYKAKTRPQVIGSSSGGASGSVVFARAVQHPGTEAREFDKVIAEKWQDELPRIFQRAIDAAIGG